MEGLRSYQDIPGVEWVPCPEPFISIDQSKCTGCGDCLRVCLGDVFRMRRKKAEVSSLDRCMECGSCLYVCEARAINFSWPAGGTGYRSEWG
jgi:NAD-dependent dihydropyrimidine dehydrogenase PreA subunit